MRSLRIGAALFTLAVALVSTAVGASSFETWSSIARAEPRSPAIASEADHTVEWRGPDASVIRVVVREPILPSPPNVVRVDRIPEETDARPALQRALSELRMRAGGTLILQAGKYRLSNPPALEPGHLVIEGLRDVLVEGNGAVLEFEGNKAGLYISETQRLKLRNLTLQYRDPAAVLGRMSKVSKGKKLVLDEPIAFAEDRRIGYVGSYDSNERTWVRADRFRTHFPPDDPDRPVQVDERSFTSQRFASVRDDERMIVFTSYYGGETILIKDAVGRPETEDIVLNGLRFSNAPGVGVSVFKMKRGLAVLNCWFEPVPGSGALVSTAFDAVHTVMMEGDVLIAGNRFTALGDDAVNLRTMVHRITSIDDAQSLKVADFARFFRPGDQIGFFGPDAQYQGSAIVTKPPGPQVDGVVSIQVDALPPGIDSRSLLRNFRLLGRRAAVVDNSIDKCQCHAVLAQVPHVLIARNTIAATSGNAIRLLTNLKQWREGSGAFNVTVSRNSIARTGRDEGMPFPAAAISVYGIAPAGPARTATNDYISITGNDIDLTMQGCISVASANNVRVADNTCRRIGQFGATDPAALHFEDPDKVVSIGNRLH